MMDALIPGAKITVVTSANDPLELCLHPHAVIAELVDGGYLVEHPGAFHPRRFGPYTDDRLIRGWA